MVALAFQHVNLIEIQENEEAIRPHRQVSDGRAGRCAIPDERVIGDSGMGIASLATVGIVI